MVAERVAAPHHALSTASSTSRADWDSFEFLPQLLEMRPVRFAYAGGLVASILAGYKLLSLRRGRLSAEKRFSPEVMALPPQDIAVLVDAYLGGDGSFYARTSGATMVRAWGRSTWRFFRTARS